MRHPTGRKAATIVLVFGTIALLLQGMIFLQGRVQDGARSYVRGEGLWAKGQKDAVLYLEHYSHSHAESDYQLFREAVAVTLGDRQARLALGMTPVDEGAAREGFLLGKNHPADIDSLIWFYRHFNSITYMRDAIEIWQAADAKVDELIKIGEGLHSLPLHDASSEAENALLRERLGNLNPQLLELENRFSLVLSEGSRWAGSTLWYTSLAILLVLLGLGFLVSWQIVRSIADSEEQLRLWATVFASSTDGIVITTPDLKIVSANHALCDMMGWSEAELRGDMPPLFSSSHTVSEQYLSLQAELNQNGSVQGDYVARSRDGSLMSVRVSISGVTGSKGQVTHYVGIVSDISERKAREAHFRHLAHHDALTGLPNRMLFDDRIRQTVKNSLRNGRKFAVLYFDLDDFKPVNDRFGHEVGDMLLKRVAECMTTHVRVTDTVTRRGGDEFAILLVDVENRAYVDEVLSRIVDSISTPSEINGHVIHIGISVGVGLFPDDGDDPEMLMHHADQGMYAMKNGTGKSDDVI